MKSIFSMPFSQDIEEAVRIFSFAVNTVLGNMYSCSEVNIIIVISKVTALPCINGGLKGV